METVIPDLHASEPEAVPFGPSLAVGVMGSSLCWPWLGPYVQPVMFTTTFLAVISVAGVAVMLEMAMSA